MQLPRTIGPWTLGAVLGRGDDGTVVEATDAAGRVALKVVRDGGASAERLHAEGRVLVRLARHGGHPGVVRHVAGPGTGGGWAWLALGVVRGRAPADAWSGRPPQVRVAQVAAVADAVAFLHALGVAHTDLRPGNVRVHGAGATVLDLGAARPADDDTRAVDGWWLGMLLHAAITGTFDHYGGAAPRPGDDRHGGLVGALLTGRGPAPADLAARLCPATDDGDPVTG